MTELAAVRLLVVRHAASELTGRVLNGCGPNASDPPLDERGISQGRALARALAGETPDRVFCSPAQRTRQTASLLGWDTAAVDSRLMEVDFGRWEGQTPSDLLAADPDYPRWWADPGLRAPAAGTSLADVAASVGAWLDERLLDSVGRTLAVVGHASTVRVLVARALALPLAESGRLSVAPTSTAVLRFWVDGGSCLDSLWTPSADSGD